MSSSIFASLRIRSAVTARSTFLARIASIRPTYRTLTNDAKVAPGTGPQSDSAAEQGVKKSRGRDDPSTTELGGSTATPISGKGDQTNQSEEGGDPQKQDKNLSDAEKRKGVESQQKPLDAADK